MTPTVSCLLEIGHQQQEQIPKRGAMRLRVSKAATRNRLCKSSKLESESDNCAVPGTRPGGRFKDSDEFTIQDMAIRAPNTRY